MMQSDQIGYAVKELPEWERKVQTLLKVEMVKRQLTYKQLSEKLAAIGVHESEPNIRNKLSRGTFSAAFLIQCLTAIGTKSLDLSAL
jgi:hypothetical protein